MWSAYIENLRFRGENSLISSIGFQTPIINDNIIFIESINENSQKEILDNKEEILNFIRKSLNNNNIQLQAIVKSIEEKQKEKYVFHKEDYYHRMVEKNPAIELLKKTFDLTLIN